MAAASSGGWKTGSEEGALTQVLDEALHVQAQRVEGGGPALVVLLVDRDGGQTAAHRPLLEHIDLYSGAEVLLEEMGHGRAPDSGPNHGCQQAQEAGKERDRARASDCGSHLGSLGWWFPGTCIS